jgi:hypothetical protein
LYDARKLAEPTGQRKCENARRPVIRARRTVNSGCDPIALVDQPL